MGGMGTMVHAGAADPFTIGTWCQLVMLTALLLTFGLSAFAVALPHRESTPQLSPDRFWSLVRLCSLTALILAPFQLLTAVASMAGTGLAQAFALTPQALQRTNFGHVWLAALPLLIGLAVTPWWAAGSRRYAGLIASLAAALLALHSLVTHAIDFGVAAIACYFIHESAAGLFAGALLGLIVTARCRAIDLADARLVVCRTSQLAGWCVALLIATGIYIAYRTLGLNLDHLLFSPYGRILIGKVGVFGIVLLLGGYNRYRLLPDVDVPSVRSLLVRSVCVECLLLLAVLGLAVLLANTPPAH